MKFIIYDVEATCWEGIRGDREIIEIGALMVGEGRQILSEFNCFVRPVRHPVLSDFCIGLTAISQKDVDGAPYFPEAIRSFQDWIGIDASGYRLCSWGYMDPNQLRDDCRYHGLDPKWVRNLLSMKHHYAEMKGLEGTLNFETVLDREGIEFTGRGHRALDDARNLTTLFLIYFDDWTADGRDSS